MAKDIYLIMKQYALHSPRLSQGEAKKSSSKQGRSESAAKRANATVAGGGVLCELSAQD